MCKKGKGVRLLDERGEMDTKNKGLGPSTLVPFRGRLVEGGGF